MAGELVLVPVKVFDDELTAVTASDGRVKFVLGRLCDILGLDPNGQRQRLLDPGRCPWAEGQTCIMHVIDSKSRPYKVFCLDLTIVGMWLATVTAGRVRKELRPKVKLYQKRCAQVLHDHFFGGGATAQVLPWGNRFRLTYGAHLRYMGTQHPGRFTIVSALAGDFMQMEELLQLHQVPTRSTDRPDISAGLKWAADRRGRGLPDTATFAPLFLPDQRRDVGVGVYDGAEWAAFAGWFRTAYVPTNFVTYLTNKPEWKTIPRPDRLAVADRVSRELTGRPACLPARR